MKTKVFATSFMLISLALTIQAQSNNKRFAVELNTGIGLATNKIAHAETKPAYGFEGVFHYRIINNVGIYAGWGWNHMKTKSGFIIEDATFEETGYVIGLQYQQQIGNSDIDYFLRSGLLYNHIEIENSDGEIVKDTGHEPGLQVAGGIAFPIGNNWQLAPGIKFNALNQDSEINNQKFSLKHQYISMRLGVIKTF